MRESQFLPFSPQIMQKSKNRAIHVYIFNDGSQNDKEIELLDQSTVQTFKHSGLQIHHCGNSTEKLVYIGNKFIAVTDSVSCATCLYPSVVVFF